MYTIDYDAFIQQALPPHWRRQWQEHLIAVWCYPLKQLFDQIFLLRKQAVNELNHNSQAESLQHKLQDSHMKIEVGTVSQNGTIKILAPDLPEVRNKIKLHLDKVKTAGKTIEFQTII